MLAVLLLLALIAGPSAAGEASSVRVLTTGDSLVQPLDELLTPPVKRAGGVVKKDPRPGTAITKPLVLDWVAYAKKQAKKHRPDVTVVFLGATETGKLAADDGSMVDCCRRAWIDAYAERVEKMMRRYLPEMGGHVYWLTIPVPRAEELRRYAAAVNVAIAQAAAAAGDRAHVVDTVPAVSPGNKFRRKLRYRGKARVVRDRDGVHLTVWGSRIVRDLVVQLMRADGVL